MATIDLQDVLGHRAQVEAFQRKHRIGLLTLLFTDIVGSTRIKQDLGDAEGFARIQAHHVDVRELLTLFPEGEEISTAGDSFFLVFAKPSEAVRFALMLQSRLRRRAQSTATAVFDRIGIHIGEVIIDEQAGASKPKDLYGIQVDICARVMSAGEGDQILMTRSTFDNARQVLKGKDAEGLRDLVWLNHGAYSMHGVEEPLELCEVGEEGLARLRPPADSEKVRRFISAGELRAGDGESRVQAAGPGLRRWGWIAAAGAAAAVVLAALFLRPPGGGGGDTTSSGVPQQPAPTPGRVLERTGFEAAEGYAAGQPLAGQQLWTRGNWPGQLDTGGEGIAAGVFGGASQHAFLGGVPGAKEPAVHASLSRPLVFMPSADAGTVQIAWKQHIRPSTDGVGNWFAWLFYNRSGQMLCGLVFDNSSGKVIRRYADNTTAVSATSFPPAKAIDVAVRLDFRQNRWNASIGGDTLPWQPIALDYRAADLGSLAVTWRSIPNHAKVADGAVAGDNVLAFDDFTVSAVADR